MSAKRKPSALQREIEDFIRAMDLGSGAKFWLPEICRLAMRHAVPEGCVVVPMALLQSVADACTYETEADAKVALYGLPFDVLVPITKLLAAAKETPHG